MLQNFQQPPVKPDTNTQPPVHNVQPQAQNVTPAVSMVAPQPPLPTQPTQQKTAFDKVTVCFCIFMSQALFRQLVAQHFEYKWYSVVQGLLCWKHHHLSTILMESLSVSQKLLDRFDYDDEPETGEEAKKDEISSQPPL